MNSAIILAAGEGTRMKSSQPKVLCRVLEEPMLGWVLDSVSEAGFSAENIGVVVGSGAGLVTEYMNKKGFSRTFLQAQRKGTGHAVMQAMPLIEESENVLILYGDAPFIDSQTIRASLETHKTSGNSVTVVTAEVGDPTGYGRIIRDENGEFLGIIEQKDCSDEQRAIREINSGVYWFSAAALAKALPQLGTANANGEYYLTDTIGIIRAAGLKAGIFRAENSDIVLGANTRANLLALNKIARERVIEKHMANGVEFICTDGIIIGKNVKIGAETLVYPNTILRGETVIGKGCVVGPNSLIENTEVGDNTALNNVQAYDSKLGNNVKIGPFVHIRPGTTIRDGVKIGDFVEVKNSVIGEKTCVAHLTYVGDSDVGQDVNFGCGCVTANYDGINKFRTVIGNHAFIGCNTNLVAPVEIGENATTGAGSTITGNVPADSLAVERTDTKIIEHWEKNSRRKRKI